MLFAGLAAWIALPANAAGEILGPTNEFTVNNGAWYTYKRNCSGCHGFRGQGNPPVGPPLVGNAFVTNARPADLAAVIRNGRKDDTKRYPQYIRERDGYMNMPPFTDLSISGSELETLVTYLKGPFQQGKFNRP
jgi:mono/diheme cytochrome c family protein